MKKPLASGALLLLAAALPLASHALGIGGEPRGSQRLLAPRIFHSARAAAASSDDNFAKGNFMISAGIGVIKRYDGSPLPLVLQGEYGVVELGPGTLGVGLSFELLSGTGYTITLTQPRVAYHYTGVDKLDLYGGLGVSIAHANITGYGSAGTDTQIAVFVGGRYFFASGFGAFGEVSSEDYATLKVGLTGKF